MSLCLFSCLYFFFCTDPATPLIYTLSLHDALPIFGVFIAFHDEYAPPRPFIVIIIVIAFAGQQQKDRKSTRLNSSHTVNSYAVFCLKKKTSITHYVFLDYIEAYHFLVS